MQINSNPIVMKKKDDYEMHLSEQYQQQSMQQGYLSVNKEATFLTSSMAHRSRQLMTPQS
jgi:hypothetical protein